ncbi:hypothetical protein VNO78_25587 [Psophocarpus tetragonolobus]|uniref:Dirigent protein n=1 Tax=Psophocarpus tetragonolobus TaxID=3891 RepID=A0AAN9XFH1_PSOTE
MTLQFLMFSLLVFCYSITFALAEETNFVRSLDRNELGHNKKEEVTHIKVYFQETFREPNITSFRIVPAVPQYSASTYFGSMVVIDAPLTAGPEPSSRVVGKAEGTVTFTSRREWSLLESLTFVFTQGKFNGSSITLFGRNPISQQVREVPVVGGTAKFRLARGYALTKTLFLDEQVGSTVQFDFYVSH